MARRPPPTVRPSKTSAARTKAVMTRAVKNSPINKAERRAMVIESSIVIFRSTMFSKASLKIGYPPIRVATMPITLMCGNGSHNRNQTAAAAMAHNADEFSPLHSVNVLFVLGARIRVVQFWGIPSLAEVRRAGWGLFDDG